MLNTIVWATDGSENAARSLSSARALLPEGAMLIAVHIVPESAGHHADGAGGTHPDPPDVVASLWKLVAEVSEDGVNVALRIADYIGPQPAKGIADIAREVGADVIVVGTRGHSPIAGVLVGSVTQSLLQIAPCPVLAVLPPPEPTRDVGDMDVVRAAG